MKKNKSNLVLKKSKKNKTEEDEFDPVIDIPLIAEDTDVDEIEVSDVSAELEESISEDEDNTPVYEKPKKIKPREREHYVNGKEFEEEIRSYYGTDHVTIKLGECINKIANGLSYAPNFINYSYKEDMVGDAIVKMFSALKNKKFRLDSGFSPFSYFTTIAFHAFINRIKKEKKHHKAITDYREKVYNELMLDPEETNGAHIYVEPGNNQYDD
jgi:hypothetical protein